MVMIRNGRYVPLDNDGDSAFPPFSDIKSIFRTQPRFMGCGVGYPSNIFPTATCPVALNWSVGGVGTEDFDNLGLSSVSFATGTNINDTVSLTIVEIPADIAGYDLVRPTQEYDWGWYAYIKTSGGSNYVHFGGLLQGGLGLAPGTADPATDHIVCGWRDDGTNFKFLLNNSVVYTTASSATFHKIAASRENGRYRMWYDDVAVYDASIANSAFTASTALFGVMTKKTTGSVDSKQFNIKDLGIGWEHAWP
jgi:hypothetical protein